MTEAEDKEKAEKLAAAKKRYEQLKKQKKSKEEKTEVPKKKKKDKVEDKTEDSIAKDDAKEEASVDDEEEATKDDIKGEQDVKTKDDGSKEDADSSTTKKDRQPSLSLASRARSESFKRDLQTDTNGGLKSPELNSTSSLVPGEERDAVEDIYKRQKERIHALEEENKRLRKEAQERSKLEEELDGLREKQGETNGTQNTGETSKEEVGVVDRLEAEITSLKHQLNTNQQSRKRRPSSSASEDLSAQLSSKQASIDTLELDISNLRHSLFQAESSTSDLESRISTLTADLETSKTENTSLTTQISTLTTDLASAKSLDAPKDSASSTSDLSSTQSQLSSTLTALTTAESTITNLTKKIETLQTLHRDSETRSTSQNALRLKEMDRLRAETTEMRKKLQARSYENARLRSVSTSSASGPALHETGAPLDSDAASTRIRELEAEVFELRSGVYRERKGQLIAGNADASAVFDEVDLSSPSVAEARARRAAGPYGAFSSLINTFTGTTARRASRPGTGAGAEKHVGFLSDSPRPSGEHGGAEFSDDEGSFAFDEEAFQAAQEEEARKRIERVREVKRKLPEWKGWRLDLVDLRGGSMAGVFEV